MYLCLWYKILQSLTFYCSFEYPEDKLIWLVYTISLLSYDLHVSTIPYICIYNTLSHLLAKINLVWQIVCLFKNKNTTDISDNFRLCNVIGTFYLHHLSGWVQGWRSSEKPLQDRLAQVRRGTLTSFRCKTPLF